MQKKLTISIDEQVYEALYHVIGKRKISNFIENLIRPKIINKNLEIAYQQMAADSQREENAEDWNEGIIEDFGNEPW